MSKKQKRAARPRGVSVHPPVPSTASSHGASPLSGSGILRWLAPVLLVLATTAAFLPTLENGFVNLDDTENFLTNKAYRGLGPAELRWMFTTWHMGGLIPLTWMTLGFDYLVWGMDPAGYHLTSLVLHVLAAVAFYFVLLRLLRAAEPAPGLDGAALRLGALFGALLFSVHPLRVESVAWVTERRDVLSGLFFLLSILAYLRAWEARAGERLGRTWYLVSLGLFLCALLSKAMAVTLPLVLVLLDIYPLRRLRVSSAGQIATAARNILTEKAPFFALSIAGSVVMLLVTSHIANSMTSLGTLSVLGRVSVYVYDLGFYLWKTVAPINLAATYELPERVSVTSWPFLLSWAAVVVITAACVVFRRRSAALPAVWVAYIAMLAPVSGLVHVGTQIAADRFTYLPCLGWAALGGTGLYLALRKPRAANGRAMPGRAVIVGTAALVVCGLAALTWRQVGVWHDTETLWVHGAAASPSARAHEALGILYEERGQVAASVAHFGQLVRIKPGYGPGHMTLGAGLAELGRVPEAISHLEEAARLMPTSAVPSFNLGVILAGQGRPAEAIERYEEALRRVPTYADAHNDLGLALATQGRLAEAVEHYREARRLRPDMIGAHINLGIALATQGRTADALQHFRDAVALQPSDARARNNLGLMLVRAGRTEEAAAQFREALRLKPDLQEARTNLERLDSQRGAKAR